MVYNMILFLALTHLSLCYCNVEDTSKYASTDIGQLVESFELKFADVFKQLETVNLELKKQIAVNDAFREKLAIQEQVIEKLNGRTSAMNGKHPKRELQSLIRKGRQEGETVAFTAYLDHEITNLAPDHTIQFGTVELNEGNAYNNHTGVFTVPMDGVYLFSFAIEDYHPHRLWTKLVVDSQLKASVIEWPGNSQNAQGSNTVVLRLKSGQSVWIAVDSRDSGDSLQGWPDLRSTMFTGVYLYP